MTSANPPAPPATPPQTSPRTSESFTKGAIFGVSALMSVWVLSAALNTYLSALDLAEVATLGQAESAFAKFRDACGMPHPRVRTDPTEQQRITTCLQTTFDTHQNLGLRFVSMSSDGLVMSVGSRLSDPALESDPDLRATPTPTGDRFLYMMPPSRDIRTHPSRTIVSLEFIPTHALALANEGRNNLIAGCLSALLILGGAWLTVRLLRERIQAQRQAADQNQLALLGRMSAVMAHELRNPLASAKGHAQLLAEMLDETALPRAHRKAKFVEQELVRVEQLTHELIEFVRSGRIQRRPHPPATLAHEAARRANLPHIEVLTDSSPPLWSLDPLAIERVLTNLLRNAAQAHDPASPSASPTITLRVELRGNLLCFSVRDHGQGFPDGLDAFAPFVTTKTFGTGLGLAICRQIIQAHHGHITSHNHPDGGAVVEALIPNAPP